MSYRKLSIDGEIWNYVIGKAGVKIKSPNDKSTWVENYKMVGIGEYETIIEDSINGISSFAFGPGDVRKYIDKHLRGKL
jgi:hypothetical protein